MSKKKNMVWLIILADILLSWVIFFICDMWLSWRIGPDVIVYENWFGDLENSVVYRFGIGSVELLISLLQVVLFVWIEIRLYKKKKVSKLYNRVAIVLHILNFAFWVLFYIDWNGWIYIPEFLLPQYIIQKIMYV